MLTYVATVTAERETLTGSATDPRRLRRHRNPRPDRNRTGIARRLADTVRGASIARSPTCSAIRSNPPRALRPLRARLSQTTDDGSDLNPPARRGARGAPAPPKPQAWGELFTRSRRFRGHNGAAGRPAEVTCPDCSSGRLITSSHVPR